MYEESAHPHIPVAITFHNRWWHDRHGFRFDEEHLSNPDYVIRRGVEAQKLLYKFYNHLGMGMEEPAENPIVEPFGITTLAQVFGCKVIFQEDQDPYAVPLNLSDGQVLKLQPVTDFENVYPVNLHLEQADYLVKKYGRAKIVINWQGILSTALKIRGEQLFTDFYENPGLAEKVLEVCHQTTENLREFINEVNKKNGFPQKERVQSSNCAVQMISPWIYEKYIMPYDRILAERYSPGYGIHHCGNNMDKFAGLYASLPRGEYYDIGYGSDVRACVESFKAEGMKQLIRGRLGPHKLLLSDSFEIGQEVKKLIAGGVNFVVCIGADQNTPDANIEAFYQSVWQNGKLQ